MAIDLFERVVCQPGVRGLYESHYLKAHGPDRGAFWIKYCVLAPRDPREPVVVELWAVVWRAGAAPRVVKRVVSASAMRLGASELLIDGAGVHLDAKRATGSLTVDGHTIAWTLAIRDEMPALRHLPYESMYTAALPKKKLLTPSPRARFSGEITVDGERIEVRDWLGLRGHNWGSEHARRYAYGNCNEWEDGARRAIDGFTAKIKLGPIESPWLNVLVGDGAEGAIAFNALRHWRARSEVSFPLWNQWFREGARAMELRWRATPDDMVGLRYLHPDGKVSYCYNTRFATLDVSVRDGEKHSAWRSERAELEFLFPAPIEGIALHGNAGFIEGETP